MMSSIVIALSVVDRASVLMTYEMGRGTIVSPVQSCPIFQSFPISTCLPPLPANEYLSEYRIPCQSFIQDHTRELVTRYERGFRVPTEDFDLGLGTMIWFPTCCFPSLLLSQWGLYSSGGNNNNDMVETRLV
ncbi:hypothetical protein VNO80_06917 [Phaseolus coccineus]|uniref:Uncharacterized protein n=1 Tax=Phaseolus coccineus TaxID=3886 RepID=A0AAN9RI09_PHACN